MDLHNILIPLYEADVKKLRTTLKRRRFEFAEREHAHFTAKKGRLHVTVYKNGPKALEQGNEARCAALTAKDPDDSWGPKWKQDRAMLTKMEKVS